MNEKINKLWDQAVTLVEQEPEGDWSLDTIKDKFAELIVRECIDWIDGSPTTEEGSLILSKHFIIANLKQHFGVEE